MTAEDTIEKKLVAKASPIMTASATGCSRKISTLRPRKIMVAALHNVPTGVNHAKITMAEIQLTAYFC
jgi:hypothetical protein